MTRCKLILAVGFAVFMLFPMLGGMGLSLFEWNGFSAIKWQGLANYGDALKDKLFWK